MTLILLRRAGIVLLLFVSFGPIRAAAGPVYLAMVIDPATTAGAGVPTIPRQNSLGTFSVMSNKSGAGSFHLYAMDDTIGSFGISSFSIALNGTVSNVFNRSPTGTFNTIDEYGEIVGSLNATAGFSDSLIRSGAGSNPTTPIQGAQELGTPYRIGRLGQTTSNFNNTPNLPAPPPDGARVWAGVTSGQWGNYATDSDFFNPGGKSWLLLGEGNYTGQAPTINFGASDVFYYSAANFDSQGEAALSPPCSCGLGVVSGIFNNVNANNPGFIDYTFYAIADLPFPDTVTWSSLGGPSYYSAPGVIGTFAAQPATFDPATQKFHWNTIGAPLGQYQWHVSASAGGYTGVGYMIVHITAVPEPATVSLLAFALAAFCNCNHRRR